MDLIITHNACPDGMTAGYIAKLRYPEATLMHRDHGLNPPYAEVEDKDVLVTDFSWRTREENIRLSKLAKSFRILDHHKTAEAELEGLDFATFDMNRSGAGLAWDYLFGKDSGTYVEPCSEFCVSERPWWVNYVEDRDLWRFALPNSKEINAYIMTFEHSIEQWEKMTKVSLDEAITSGKAILLQVDHYVREATKHAQNGMIEGYAAKILNVPYLNCSEVGNELSKLAPVSVTWFERGDKIVQFSLRSKGDIDVSAIAKIHGGGGHKNAAGFQMELKEARYLLDMIR